MVEGREQPRLLGSSLPLLHTHLYLLLWPEEPPLSETDEGRGSLPLLLLLTPPLERVGGIGGVQDGKTPAMKRRGS